MKKFWKKKKKKKYIKSSKLETKFAAMLRKWGVKYKRQYRIRYKYYDFYLPKYNLIVETDGTYFHGYKKKYKKLNKIQAKSKKNDLYKNGLAKITGHNIIRFWEHTINNNPGLVKKKLFDKIKLITEENK